MPGCRLQLYVRIYALASILVRWKMKIQALGPRSACLGLGGSLSTKPDAHSSSFPFFFFAVVHKHISMLFDLYLTLFPRIYAVSPPSARLALHLSGQEWDLDNGTLGQHAGTGGRGNRMRPIKSASENRGFGLVDLLFTLPPCPSRSHHRTTPRTVEIMAAERVITYEEFQQHLERDNLWVLIHGKGTLLGLHSSRTQISYACMYS